MTKTVFTEEELRSAVYAYGEAWRKSCPSEDPGHVFSELYKSRKTGVLSASRKRQARLRIWQSIASVFIVLVLAFGMVLAASPTVRAAVLNWTVNVYNRIIDYRFYHNEDDHAFLICDPGSIPEGFVRTEEYHNGYYARKVYTDPDTGSYIKLEYRKPTESQIKSMEKQAASAELFLEDGVIKKYFTQKGAKYKLFWYDPQRNLVFHADSNLDKATLADCFKTINFRLPLYEPAWLPEGYEEIDRTNGFLNQMMIYMCSNQTVVYEYSDMAEMSIVSIEHLHHETEIEHLVINGSEGYYHPHEAGREGGDLIIIDENNKLVFMIEANISRDEIIKVSESIVCTETDW